ncbi:MAG: iron uptake porin [Cyanosarcina radialis HA8281-LM2]|jgi:BMFP domain-containing protein YqiC|nr:iron uptake porin [Cyanosarcina radialis HA8281-LM2]
MSKLLWNALKACPALFGTSLMLASSTLAAPTTQLSVTAGQSQESIALGDSSNRSAIVPAGPENRQPTLVSQTTTTDPAPAAPANTENLEQIERYTNDGNPSSSDNPMGQITNASQFRDVQPTDWAYEALDRVVQRYGCLVGYPDGTYRGQRSLSRYEFAAGLNACLRQIEALIEAQGEKFVTKEDFEALQRLVEEFRTELSALNGRVDNLEGRVSFLEAHQFSTTTKLAGEVIFSYIDTIDDRNSPGIFSDRVRLNLDTSFTGQDRLRTRLQARNTPTSNVFYRDLDEGGTNMARVGYDGDNQNDVVLGRLQYRTPLGSQGTLFVEATGMEWNDTLESFSPLFEPGSSGALSRFGRFSPIYRQSRDGAGVGLNYKFTDAIGVSLAYATPGNQANDPDAVSPGVGGLFNGSYAALAQLNIKPSDAIGLGLTYVRSFNPAGSVDLTGSTGSGFAQRPFGNTVDTSADHFGLEANFRITPQVNLGGWVGFTNARVEDAEEAVDGASADLFNFAVTLGFPDLGKKGNLLGFVFGIPPKVTSSDFDGRVFNGVLTTDREDSDTSFHIEGFYRYRLTDNIEITPGIIVILNPEHNSNNDDIYQGVIRTTFKF